MSTVHAAFSTENRLIAFWYVTGHDEGGEYISNRRKRPLLSDSMPE